MTRRVLAIAVLAMFGSVLVACGGGDDDSAGDDDHEEFDFGAPADEADADRVIEISLQDPLRFVPSSVTVAEGEVVTFEVTNESTSLHDFTIGDADAQEEHAKEMAEAGADAEMHDEANAIFVEPGETKTLTWSFTEAGELEMGCHVAGHYAGGMKGTIDVEA